VKIAIKKFNILKLICCKKKSNTNKRVIKRKHINNEKLLISIAEMTIYGIHKIDVLNFEI
tara:strand:+ start:205 stop:384 length:180 start_codon:yes stop_codon:yes gene_type:complete